MIHVAGTNGKGSACAFSRAMLEAQGLKVHVHISPHLVRFHERIRIAGEADFGRGAGARCWRRWKRSMTARPITFFEITGAAMFLAFSRHPADAMVLEVGLGGNYDATNVVPNPAMTMIQPVGLDHMEFLGNDLAGIAARESRHHQDGHRRWWWGRRTRSPREVILRRADQLSAPVFVFGQDFSGRQEHGRMVYEDETGLLDLPLPA